jgi:tetratricopeptide (TPR) repeat protein
MRPRRRDCRPTLLALAVWCTWVPGLASAQSPPSAAAAPQLVMPFENDGGEPRAYWLGEGSAVILTDDLVALGVPAIARDDRVRAFEALRVPAVASLSHATMIRVGQVVGASQVIVGAVELRGDDLIVRARTIRLDAGRMSPEIVERGPLTDLFAIYARVARRLVPDSIVTVEQMEEGHPPLAAFEQYIKGVLAEAPDTKVTFLTNATRQAPEFLRPRLALWSVYTEEDEHQQALAAVRAVPSGDRLGREARFRAAISLVHLTQYQEAHDIFSELHRAQPDPALLNNLGLVQLRRPIGAAGGRAADFFSDAARLDPNDADLCFNAGYAFWLERDLANAVWWWRETVRRNPADDEAHYALGVALQALGSGVEGTREKELARRLSSVVGDWEAKQPANNPLPRGIERLKDEIDLPAALRLSNVIVATGQRDQQESAVFHLESGRRLYASERDVEAINALRRAVYLAPYQSEAHLLLGRIYLRQGRIADAIDAFKISIWSEDAIVARLALAEAYVTVKEDALARAELQAVLRRDPANADARTLLDRLP